MRNPGAARWMALGRVAIMLWYLGGFAVLLLPALLQVGPFGWASAWQIRHAGRDNALLSFLPGFAILAIPVIVLQLMPRRPDRPFLCGAQDALAPRRAGPVQPASLERMARILLRCARGGLIATALFLLAGGLGYTFVSRIGARDAGTPLPELTLAAIMAPASPLPGYARLIDVKPRPEATWLHEHVEGRVLHRDYFTPLTAAGWQPGDPVALLEEDRTTASEDWSAAGPRAGSIEGALARDAVPGWVLGELRGRGIAVTDDPAVLTRQELDGVVPGADLVVAIMCLVLGATFALFSLGVSLAWLHRRRKLLRDVQAHR